MAGRKKTKSVAGQKMNMMKSLEERTKRLVSRDYKPAAIKDIEKLERQLHIKNEELSARIKHLESAFITFSDSIRAMKKEQQKLIREKEKLKKINKELELRIAGIDVGAIASAAADKFQKSIHENVEILQHVASSKDDDYERKLEEKQKAKELSREDREIIFLIKKTGRRSAKVKTNNLGRLYLFVQDAGSAKTSDAAQELKIDEASVEGMAEVLKNHKLIKIQYPAFGKPILMKK